RLVVPGLFTRLAGSQKIRSGLDVHSTVVVELNIAKRQNGCRCAGFQHVETMRPGAGSFQNRGSFTGGGSHWTDRLDRIDLVLDSSSLERARCGLQIIGFV